MKKTTEKHIIVKLLKTKDEEKILKVAREKRHIIYRGEREKHDNWFFVENNVNKREWGSVFRVLKGGKKKHGILCPLKIYFKMKVIWSFSDL